MDKRPIEILGLPTQHERALRASFVRTVGALKQRAQGQLTDIPGVGHCGVILIKQSLDMQSQKDRTHALAQAIHHA